MAKETKEDYLETKAESAGLLCNICDEEVESCDKCSCAFNNNETLIDDISIFKEVVV